MTDRVRIVVTGLGAVTPFGVGVPLFWDGVISGRSAVRETPDEHLRQWAPATAHAADFDAAQYLDKKQVQNTDRFTQMGLVAAMEAFQDAGWNDSTAMFDSYRADRIGISVGCAFGGVQTLEDGAARLSTGRSSRVGPRLVPKSIPNAAGAAIAMQYGIRGPVMTYSTACASSANSIGEASYWLRLGEVDMVLAGGAECLFSPAILAGLRAAGALATDGPEDFGKWSRPFDKARTGMIMGEGAAMLVLETLEHAQARGARIYAELIGYGTSNDAYHETSPDPQGRGAKLAMERAIQHAGLTPESIDYINAHATATPAGDIAESAALRDMFGDHLDQIPVSSIKGAVGHMLGTAGAIESIACIEALATGTLPPTLNCEDKEPLAPKDVVPNQSRKQHISYALSNSFGFGGQNGVLVWKNPDLI
ncbi:beta-ketoacyl-[acyl-carrier-protein] synthase family protein [Alicyclobacillus fastidiosus]|uniref:3-oxoacyl-[acyl-carrier-protein] synthase 2 n=1 Tax=Alicyclobacillus fastidiosus TaxID=392011 RepID=A0ABV5ABR3_9BACL|nr:beta-ketoacyl-[acyl-carrier-protein] synthase family protein [Alicyclobacillus fastidiosus]WEH10374.1 beta-ketoacyl-[acyl-carrier-protein] synthase family protein [Alicyclobacillus fastidiosus]